MSAGEPLAEITQPCVVTAILAKLRLPTETPSVHPVRGRPALLDTGLIGFDNVGRMLVADGEAAGALSAFGLGGVVGLRAAPSAACGEFLRWHREHVLRSAKRSARAHV